jgi:hypothetical protein
MLGVALVTPELRGRVGAMLQVVADRQTDAGRDARDSGAQGPCRGGTAGRNRHRQTNAGRGARDAGAQGPCRGGAAGRNKQTDRQMLGVALVTPELRGRGGAALQVVAQIGWLFSCGEGGANIVTRAIGIQSALVGMRNRTCGPYLARTTGHLVPNLQAQEGDSAFLADAPLHRLPLHLQPIVGPVWHA